MPLIAGRLFDLCSPELRLSTAEPGPASTWFTPSGFDRK